MRTTLPLVVSLAFSLTGCSVWSGIVRPQRTADAPSVDRRTERYVEGHKSWVRPAPLPEADEAVAGKVVFSSGVTRGAAAEVSSIRLGDPLHFRFVTDDAPYNARPHCNADSPRRLVVNAELKSASGAPVVRVIELRKLSDEESRGRVVASPTGDVSVASKSDWSRPSSDLSPEQKVARTFNTFLMPQLGEGENHLAVTVTVDCTGGHPDDPILARGELTIVVKPGDKQKYLAQYGTQVQPAANAALAALSPKVKELFEIDKHGAEKGKTLGVRVISPEWTKRRNELTGIVTEEWINAAIVLQPKTSENEGACELYWLSVVRHPGESRLRASAISDPTPFWCMNAPK